jgi:hypothetical protein
MPIRNFIVHCPTTDTQEFKRLCALVKPLKAHARVEVNISEVSGRAEHDVPGERSPWHHYALYNPAPFKFFPHAKIAPHVPEAWVARNRELLLAKSGILSDHGLDAAFWSYEPPVFPDSFFEAHPHLRGARIDHPRRSTREAFGICVDHPESLEMIQWMAAELKRHVPHLRTFMFKTNDAGAGFCWAAANYSGSNGPSHCRGRHMGERVAGMLRTIQTGMMGDSGPVDIRIGHSNFWNNEGHLIKACLPPNCFVAGYGDDAIATGTRLGSTYPILGMLDPVSIVSALEGVHRDQARTVFLDFRASYDRCHEMLDTAELAVQAVRKCLERRYTGLRQRNDLVHAICSEWSEVKSADDVFEAFCAFHECTNSLKLLFPSFKLINYAVGLRYLTRPLLIDPKVLSASDEAYFLPHVFNISEDAARTDYLDCAGSRQFPGSSGNLSRLDRLSNTAQSCGRSIQAVGEKLDKPALADAGKSLRIWASLVRSFKNFFQAQEIRGRLAAAPPVRLGKTATDGDPDLLQFNRLQRDEVENATELKEFLQNGAEHLIAHAPRKELEDCLSLGPGIVAALEKKIVLMHRHLRDAEKYFVTPLK